MKHHTQYFLIPQIGSRFGHAIIAIDINGDDLDDLVVGAPLFKAEAQVGVKFLHTKLNA